MQGSEHLNVSGVPIFFSGNLRSEDSCITAGPHKCGTTDASPGRSLTSQPTRDGHGSGHLRLCCIAMRNGSAFPPPSPRRL